MCWAWQGFHELCSVWLAMGWTGLDMVQAGNGPDRPWACQAMGWPGHWLGLTWAWLCSPWPELALDCVGQSQGVAMLWAGLHGIAMD